MANNQKELKASDAVKRISKDKLRRYIQKYLDDGYTPAYLKQFLLDQGYDKDLVEKAYSELGLKLEPELQERFQEIEKKLASSNIANFLAKIPTWAYVAIAVILVLAVLGIFYPAEEATDIGGNSGTFAVKDCGRDKNCFIAEARKCSDAVYTQDLEGSSIEFSSRKLSEEEARSTGNNNGNDCVITKRFKSFSADEPQEIKDLFQELEMKCSYKKESFDANLADDLVAGIDKCDGLLKDAIYELRIAQIELE